jgi:hypothetical protein
MKLSPAAKMFFRRVLLKKASLLSVRADFEKVFAGIGGDAALIA